LASWLQFAITTVFASSGFWAYWKSRGVQKNAFTSLLMGLAYNKIITDGVVYIQRGWITRGEYEDLRKYFYEPYRSLGGNGVAEEIMSRVSELPFRTDNRFADILPPTQPEEPTNVRIVARSGQ
jgi:hypothetical protein